MQNVRQCPSDRLQGILVRLFLTPKSRHICNSFFHIFLSPKLPSAFSVEENMPRRAFPWRFAGTG
jgi:hypothetical protein